MREKYRLSIISIAILLFSCNIVSCQCITNNEDISFSNNEEIIKLAVVGDILATKNIQETAARSINNSIDDPYLRVASGFESLFDQKVIELLSSADITFGNLETPIAEGLTEKWYYDDTGRPVSEEVEIDPGILYDNNVYKYNPMMIMNAHPALAIALKNIGFDVVSTANNHYANRASNGIDKTIDALREAELDFVGTIRYDELIDENNDGFPDNKAYIIKEVKGVKIAFLAYVCHVNHINGGFQWQPFFCNGLLPADEYCSRQTYCSLSNNSKVEFNVRSFCNCIGNAKEEADIVAVSLHAGFWLRHNPSLLQKAYIKRFIESGADIIIGHGPHVLQPIEIVETEDNRKVCIFNSLGNFICDGGTENRGLVNNFLSVIGYVNIIKNDDIISVHNYSYTPIFSLKNNKNTKVVVADNSYKKSFEIIDIIINGNDFQRYLLSELYLLKVPGGKILIRDDMLPERYITIKWFFENLLRNK